MLIAIAVIAVLAIVAFAIYNATVLSWGQRVGRARGAGDAGWTPHTASSRGGGVDAVRARLLLTDARRLVA